MHKTLLQTKKAKQISLELVHILEMSAWPLSKLQRGEKGRPPWPCPKTPMCLLPHGVRGPLLPPGPSVHVPSQSQLCDRSETPAGQDDGGTAPTAPLPSPALSSPGFPPPHPSRGRGSRERAPSPPGPPEAPRKAATLTRSILSQATWLDVADLLVPCIYLQHRDNDGFYLQESLGRLNELVHSTYLKGCLAWSKL